MNDLKKMLFSSCLLVLPCLFARATDYYYDNINNSNVTITAGNTLSVGSGTGNYIYLGFTASGYTLNVSAANAFTANVGNLYVGVNNNQTTSSGTLSLGTNNSITATKIVMGGNEPDSDNSSSHSATVTTAANGITTIITPSMALGTSKGTGNFTLGSGATLNLGSSGSRTVLVIGRSDCWNGYDRPGTGNMNLSSGIANLYLSSLVLGRKTVDGSTTSTSGTLTLGASSANHLNVEGASGSLGAVTIGYTAVAGMASQGVLTIGNMCATNMITSTDNGNAVYIGAGALATGTMNLNGGTLTFMTTGSAIAGGSGTSRLNLKNCTLKAGASSTNWISGLTTATLTNTVTFDSGTNALVISQSFSGTGGITKKGTGSMLFYGTNVYTGTTTADEGTLFVSGSYGGNAVVASGAAFGGSGTLNGSATYAGGANAVFRHDGPLNITGSLVLSGTNAVHLILPDNLEKGNYPLMTFNPSGSSGKFATHGIIDSGSVDGMTRIVMTENTVTLQVIASSTLIIIR